MQRLPCLVSSAAIVTRSTTTTPHQTTTTSRRGATTTALPPVQYSFDDFLSRLERSPEHHLHPLYTENALLFESRPDMLIRALGTVSWRRACTLLSAARHRQTLPIGAYRTALAQMVKHNRSVGCDGGGSGDDGESSLSREGSHKLACDWRVAMTLVADAHDRFAEEVPSRMYTSALRCCAPTQQWEQAIRLVKHRVRVLHDYEQLVAFPSSDSSRRVGGQRYQRPSSTDARTKTLKALFYISQLPRHTLVETAMACSTDSSWIEALQVLELCATTSPETFLLPSRGSQDRPNPHSLLPPTPQDEVPPPPSPSPLLKEPLVSSELAALISIHTRGVGGGGDQSNQFLSLPPAEKTRVLEMLCKVVSVCPEEIVNKHPLLQRTLQYVLTLGSTTQDTLLGGSKGMNAVDENDGDVKPRQLPVADEFKVSYLKLPVQLQSQQRLLSLCLRRATWTSAIEALFPTTNSIYNNKTQKGTTRRPTISYTPAIVAALLQKLPLEALQANNDNGKITSYSGGSDGIGAMGVVSQLKQLLPKSVLLHRDVTTTLLHRYIVAGNIHGALSFVMPEATSVSSSSSSGAATTATTSDGHSLALSGHPLDTTLASTLVLQLWRQGESKRCVEFMSWCARTNTRLSIEALIGGMECVAKESMVRVENEQLPSNTTAVPPTLTTKLQYPANAVHWKTALSWAVDLPQPDPTVSSSSGAAYPNALPHPSRVLGSTSTPPIHPRVLSILVFLCTGYGSPHGALRALAYARVHGADAGGLQGVDLRHWKALEAILFCGMYGRPEEAAAIVMAQHKVRDAAEVEQLARLVALMFPGSQ